MHVPKNPPKNRLPACLGILDIEIEWDGGVHRTDPNELAMTASRGDYPLGLPFSARPSILSGKPAYLYREDDFELALTLPELDRFVRKALRPKEFKAILAHIGMAHAIHDDFYDEERGTAIQPMTVDKAGLAACAARIAALAEREKLRGAVPAPAKASKPRSI